MRLVFAIAFLCVACGARELDPKDQRLSTATGRLNFDGKPFSGATVSRNQDAVERRSYLDGVEHGEYSLTKSDGRKLEERYFHQGNKHGLHKAWYENGNLKFEQEFASGMNIGEYISYHSNGKPFEYKKFNPKGQILVAKMWRPNGQIYSNQSFDPEALPNGVGVPGSKLCNSVKTNGAREKS